MYDAPELVLLARRSSVPVGTVVLLWRDHTRVLARKSQRRLPADTGAHISNKGTAVDLALVFRVGLFTGYILITFGYDLRPLQHRNA